MENLDGFVFRRNTQRVCEKMGGCKKEDTKTIAKSTEDIFDFKFRRKGKSEETQSEIEGGFSTVIIKEAPRRERELHARLGAESTIDDLVRLCISQVSKSRKTTYSVNLENAFLQGREMVRKRDIEKEMDEVQRRISWALDEGEKWRKAEADVLELNRIVVKEFSRVGRDFGVREKMECVRREFVEKADKLEFLKESARFSIAHVREQSEELLKKIFEIVCKEKEVDTFFLLKALSRVSK